MSEGSVHKKKVQQKRSRRIRAHRRVRNRVRGTSERPRLAVYRSLQHLYAQLIDDDQGTTLAQASTLDKEVAGQLKASRSNKEAARLVGQVIAERAKASGIESVVFDRGGFIYHGRIQQIAEGAREKGLRF
jgi:large subunit ribosomal protein L18